MASLAPSAAMTGFSVNRTRLYRPQVWMGWVVLMVGVGLLITLEAGTETGVAVGYLVICGIGLGCVHMCYPHFVVVRDAAWCSLTSVLFQLPILFDAIPGFGPSAGLPECSCTRLPVVYAVLCWRMCYCFTFPSSHSLSPVSTLP